MSYDPPYPDAAKDPFNAVMSKPAAAIQRRNRDFVVGKVRTADGYNPRFADWLLVNWSVWLEFEKAADAVVGRGKTGYSAYVIVNVLRWQADVRGITFRMTNTFTPDLARLYNDLLGRKFFTTSTRFGKETTACSSAT